MKPFLKETKMYKRRKDIKTILKLSLQRALGVKVQTLEKLLVI